MKILWLVNIIMPELAEHLGKKPSVFGGWLTGAMKAVRESGNELVICTTGNDTGRYDVNGVTYYICKSEVQSMREILDAEKPDVVHIYGTEFQQSWAMAQAADPNKMLVTIQGAMTYLKDVVYAGIPEDICRDNTMHKLLRTMNKGGESIELQKRSFERRAELEKKVLFQAKYINGGSEWGNAVAKSINLECTTLSCGLILRDSFYCDEIWDYESCDKHSIYILYSYPIKGFHKFLEALKTVVKKYPDTKVRVVANKLPYRHYRGLKKSIMDSAQDYNWYVQNMIEEYNLKDNIEFVGHLDEQQVKELMLKSNVFVSASAMENQSTSLGEAMILGVPSVASCVGAIQEMIDDGVDGFMYPFNEPYILADKIIRIFEDDELAKKFSAKGHEHASRTYNREDNCRKLLGMYETIDKNAKEKEI